MTIVHQSCYPTLPLKLEVMKSATWGPQQTKGKTACLSSLPHFHRVPAIDATAGLTRTVIQKSR